MVSKQSVTKQLKDLDFNHKGWGRTEVNELHNILLPDEKIYDLVNGFYEGGFALLVGTDVRVLLIDKKPLNYLTVEDLRFDMINEIDYSHRLIGANIHIATGNRTLKFTTINQPRLRKLIGHVQDCMAATKKQQSSHAEDQKTHLKEISDQLQVYLSAQQQYNQQVQAVQQAQRAGMTAPPLPTPVKPSPELSDFLFAQSLMAQYNGDQTQAPVQPQLQQPAYVAQASAPIAQRISTEPPQDAETQELYNEGVREIFGKRQIPIPSLGSLPNPLELNPMKIAYSKLPMALRNRKFGRPSFHAHSAAEEEQPRQAEAPAPYY